MPPRARAQQAWKTGNRRPRKPWAKRVQQGFRKQLRKRPVLGLVLQIGFAVLAVVLLVTGLVLETMLFHLAAALAGLGGLATRRAVLLEQERQKRTGPKVTPPKPGPRQSTPKRDGAPPPPPAGGPVRCTETGKPIEGDTKCTCASRHVATEDGARRYGRPVGTPLGRKSKQQKAGNTVKTGG